MRQVIEDFWAGSKLCGGVALGWILMSTWFILGITFFSVFIRYVTWPWMLVGCIAFLGTMVSIGVGEAVRDRREKSGDFVSSNNNERELLK